MSTPQQVLTDPFFFFFSQQTFQLIIAGRERERERAGETNVNGGSVPSSVPARHDSESARNNTSALEEAHLNGNGKLECSCFFNVINYSSGFPCYDMPKCLL